MWFYAVVLSPHVMAFMGRWIGGHANARQIRQATAWSFVPSAVASTLCILPLAAFGSVLNVIPLILFIAAVNFLSRSYHAWPIRT
jgi:hypothetical protein